MNVSYLEKCIQSLPAEKQAAAREAFKEISEGGDDSIFSKVLVTLEATSSYAQTLPQAITASGEKLLRELDARAQSFATQQTNAKDQREEFLRQQVAALGQTLGGGNFSTELKAQTAELGRIKNSLSRLRYARVGGLLFLMLIGVTLGAIGLGASYWSRYQAGMRSAEKLAALDAAGIAWDYRQTEQGDRVRIEGPRLAPEGVTWRKNASGQIVGVNLLFTSGGEW